MFIFLYTNAKLITYMKIEAINEELGFTLVELFVVFAVVGILSAVALSFFVEYKVRGHDAAASHDVRTIASSQEAYFIDNATYIACVDNADCISKLDGVNSFSDSVIASSTGDIDTFLAEASASKGSGRVYQYSNDGGFVVIE